MAINYPGSLDSFTNPSSSDSMNAPSHAGQHADANDALEALQAKLGTGTGTAAAAAAGSALVKQANGTVTWDNATYVPALVVDAATYGDGVTDATAHIQAKIDAAEAVAVGAYATGATVYIPEGDYRINSGPLTVEGRNITIRGAGRLSTRLITTSTDLIHLSPVGSSTSGILFEDLSLASFPGGGHVIDVQYSASGCTWRRVLFDQNNDAKSGFRKATNFDFNTNLFDDCRWEHTLTATVPMINLPGNLVSNNEWRHNDAVTCGKYWLSADPQTAGAFHFANQVRGLIGQNCPGGLVQMKGAIAATVENVGAFDLSVPLTQDNIQFGTSTGGLNSTSCTVRTYVRAGGSLAGGIDDVSFIGATSCLLDHGAATSGTFTVDLGLQVSHKILGGVNTFTNEAGRTHLAGGAHSGLFFRLFTRGNQGIYAGTGTPEAVVTADKGSIFMRWDGGAGTSMYVKESGSGNTGWVGK